MAQETALVIGTRCSPLALRQAHEAQDRLAAVLGWERVQLPLSVIKTTGDMIQDRPLSEAGGKGLFTKELDVALLDGAIDLAVHSAKDLPMGLPDGLAIAGYLPREDARDAFVSRIACDIATLPRGAVVGSASLRRQAQIKRARPDVEITLLRGNVGTRLARTENGEIAATLLAVAGLKRLGLLDHATAILDTDEFLPAVGQGAIALVARAAEARVERLIAPILDHATGVALAAERAFLAVLDGSCRTPIAGHARLVDGQVSFRGLVLRPDGSQSVEVARNGAAADAERIGDEAGREVKARMPPGMMAL
jgi:hydroxymethylbilane synthase